MSSNQNLNYDIDDIVNKSFDNFIQQNQILYPNLNMKILEKWNFEENLKQLKLINDFQNEDFIKTLPNIFELNENSKPTLIKALLSIQFITENQLYIGANFNKKLQKYETNKFHEPNNSENNENDNNDKILVLDYTNNFSKINKTILVIGAGYYKNGYYLIHSWKIIPNYLSNKFEKLYTSLSINNSQELIYANLKKILLDIFNNDSIVCDYIILYLFSQVLHRIGYKTIGILPLNIILDKKDTLSNEKIEKFHNLLKSICLSINYINITIKDLNSKRYYSKFDIEKEELEEGELQLSDGSFVLLNEMKMGEGKLEDIGCKNVQTIKNLIDFEKISYEYPFNNIEMPHNIQLIIFSNGNNSIFKSPFLVSLPINKFEKKEEDEIMIEDNIMEKIFIFINYIRLNPSYLSNFKITDENSNKIQKDYLEKNKKMNVDEFDLMLNMSRLFALSNGRNELLFSDYEYVYQIEKQRKERLNKNIINK